MIRAPSTQEKHTCTDVHNMEREMATTTRKINKATYFASERTEKNWKYSLFLIFFNYIHGFRRIVKIYASCVMKTWTVCLTWHENARATIDAIPRCGRVEPRLSRMPVERHRMRDGMLACSHTFLLAVVRHWLAGPLNRLTVPRRRFAGSTQSHTAVPRDRLGPAAPFCATERASAHSLIPHPRSAWPSRSRTHHSAAPLGLSVPRRHVALSFRSRISSVWERYISVNPSRPRI